ncbi:MAG: hypothetical protein AAF251_06835 [Pseudomonadota bacterium]
MLTLTRHTNSWQLILADLALILFLVTAAALGAGAGVEEPAQPAEQRTEVIAPAQALYRAGPGLPSLAGWLEQQPRDPRTALTIVAEHRIGDDERAWSDARAMAATAAAMNVRSRVIIRAGRTNAVHASLAYDIPES